MNIHDQINEHFSDMGQEAKPIKLSEIEAEALRKAREHEAEQDKQMAADAHDKIQGAL